MSNKKPAGWVLVHRRAFGADLTFGPFATKADAIAWAESRSGWGLRAVLVPLTDPATDPKFMWDDLILEAE